MPFNFYTVYGQDRLGRIRATTLKATDKDDAANRALSEWGNSYYIVFRVECQERKSEFHLP